MEIAHIRTFLVLAEELHFGHASERLHTSQPMISRRIASLEREIGGTLFERSSRRVRLTPLGSSLRDELLPGFLQIQNALEHATTAARGVGGLLRIGCTISTEGPALTALITAYQLRYPGSEVRVEEVPMMDPYAALRAGEIDVLVNWLAVDEPDLTVGPALEYERRVLAVSSRHRLAHRNSICVDDLAGESTVDPPSTFPRDLWEAWVPTTTPSGRTLVPAEFANDMAAIWSLVARGRVVHPTVESMAGKLGRDDIVLVPISDMPSMPLGLIWDRSFENARIRGLAAVARSRNLQDHRATVPRPSRPMASRPDVAPSPTRA
ncbi:MAG: LysR family transcriptional regulator [Acidimicrobiales bacterium]